MSEPLVVLPHTGLRVPHARLRVTSLKTMPTPDGEAFTATLRLDGRIVGHIHNDGNGGATTWSTNGTGFSWRELDAFIAACRTPHGTAPAEEHVLDDLVEEYATSRIVTKHVRANRSPLRLCRLVNGLTYTVGLAAATTVTTPAHRARLVGELAVHSPAEDDEWWQLWTGAAWDDLTQRPTPPEAGACGCPATCPVCAQPEGDNHDEDCPWTHGSARTEALQESPAIAAAPTVTVEHTHRGGCEHVVRRPGPLFEPIDAQHVRCTMCGAVDTIQARSIPSFGGTTEGYERCTACGQTYSWADISAVL
jgi:hypothetical protein